MTMDHDPRGDKVLTVKDVGFEQHFEHSVTGMCARNMQRRA